MKYVLWLLAGLALANNAAAQAADHAAHHAVTPATAVAQTEPVKAIGVVRAINLKDGSLIIAHEAVPALSWQAMTMPFKVADPTLLKGLKVGDKIRFELQDKIVVGLTVL